MLKKIAFGAAGLLLVTSPVFASAQTLADLQLQLQAALAQLNAAITGGSVLGASDDEPGDITPIGVFCPQLSITMQKGARDSTTRGQVSELQAFLTEYYDLDENIVVGGYFGNLTHKYVVRFQGEQGLPTFGIVGSLTRAKIAQVCGGVRPIAPITVTAPNGGEQWEIGIMNTVTWTPYGYNPDINPAKDVIAYLEYKDKATGQFVVLGQVSPAGKASIHWNVGQINPTNYPGKEEWAPPGEYWIRVVNNVTGASDRSDASFRINPRTVDVQVDGSDGPVIISPSQKVWVTWNSIGKDSCTLYGVSDVQPPYGGNQPSIANLPSQGKREVYVWFYDPSYGATVNAHCTSQTGQQASDWVQVNTTPQPASLKILSPNGGEKLSRENRLIVKFVPFGITKFSVALYKNDQWIGWLLQDTPYHFNNQLEYGVDFGQDFFVPILDAHGFVADQAVYKIYITAQKTDGSGYVEDKSDASFSFTTGKETITAAPASGAAPLSVQFGLAGLNEFNPPPGTVTPYFVYFGEPGDNSAPYTTGTIGKDIVTHVYSNPGTYTAHLNKKTGPDAETEVATAQVTVTASTIPQGSQTITTSGTFSVPAYDGALKVQCWGGGGGGAASFGGLSAGNGGASSFGNLTAGGGVGGWTATGSNGHGGGGAGGVASGGTTNTPGTAGADGNYGTGGTAPNGGGAGGIGGNNSSGKEGSVPGGGGGAGDNGGASMRGGGGGSGAYASKTYATGELAAGTQVSVTIGAAGLYGNDCGPGCGTIASKSGHNGGRGECRINWGSNVTASPQTPNNNLANAISALESALQSILKLLGQ